MWGSQDFLTHIVILGSSSDIEANTLFLNIRLPLQFEPADSLVNHVLLSNEAIFAMASRFDIISSL